MTGRENTDIMKKAVSSILIAAALVVAGQQAVMAVAPQSVKEIKKEGKAKLKELKKADWEVFGSARTLDAGIEAHYDRIAEGAVGVVGTAGGFQSKNVGHQLAVNDACSAFAEGAAKTLKAKMGASGKEVDEFIDAYKRFVEKEVKSRMQESFSVIRPSGNGTYEMQAYFTVPAASASSARVSALNAAAKESPAAKAFAETAAPLVK